MDWFIGSKGGEAKRLIAQLGDVTKRERAAQELIRLGADSVTPLIEALQTKDPNLLPYYQQILARIPAAVPVLVKALQNAHPLVRGRVVVTRNTKDFPAQMPGIRVPYTL